MDICPCNICPGDICPYQQYLSCYWPDFDQILKVGSWELFKHILTFTKTFVDVTFVMSTFVHISNISAVTDSILTKLQSQLSGTIFNRCQLSLKFVLATFNMATFVHSINISAVTERILTKLFSPNFYST